ncbi:MAG: topoisomerase DNA-binding C4 zinc finger domain-containing protein [Ignavibacteria bacterium]|nr:topoisomerase DNA-binding C4 zinc finger domain-containing protein [Ignavibacteria bacterium]
MVLTQPDEYSYGEERRLFYVAMTRSRKKTFVISDVSRGKSAFAAELESEAEYGIELHGVDQTMQKCDKCGSGTMSVKQGKNGSFYACSNYPLCTNTSNSIRSSSVGVCR